MLSPTGTERHLSELPTARERFLARILDQAFDDGWRTPEDFLRHFPPSVIVESLARADDLRVKLLVGTTGANERLALKKSVASAAEDVALALEEEITTPATVVSLYPPDAKVRYLPADALWKFYAEDEFFNAERMLDAERHVRAAARLTFALEVALDEKLITLRDIADGITFDEIAERLPVEDLREVVKHAMQLARADAPLSEERFHAVVPLGKLASYIPLAHTWERVIIDRVAAPAGFCERLSSMGPPKAAAPLPPPAPPPVAKKPEAPPPLPPPPAKKPDTAPPSPPPLDAPLPPLPPEAAASPPGAAVSPPSAAALPPGGERPEEDATRRRVLDRLASIERLPPSPEKIPTPVLLSIESMYADLANVSGDDEREAVVQDAFPNESHLRLAMLGLIELLDPNVDTNEPVIRDADPHSLVKIVLFEERRRSEPRRSSVPVTPSGPLAASSGTRRSVPPPIPRAGSNPPPRQARRLK
jgi:hypothetical protein